jgi:hypothetical protein
VIARTDKTLNIVVSGREITESADAVKPAYMDGAHHGTGSPPTQPSSARNTSQQDSNNPPEEGRTQPEMSMLSGITLRFRTRLFNLSSYVTAGGGDVGTPT